MPRLVLHANVFNRIMRPLVRFGVLTAMAATVLYFTWPLLAAVEFIQPFTIMPTSNNISMSWITGSEYNVASFDILCKREDEPESSYHLIKSIPAMGGLNQSASYAYTFSQGFDPNVSYCFRLSEVTTDIEPGDYFDRCGYGLNITPTPGAAPTFTPIVVITATATITGGLPITVPNTIIDANGNVVTVTPDPNQQPINNSPLPAPDFNSPLPAPDMTLTAQAAGINEGASQFPSPEFTPTETETPSPTWTPPPLETPTFSPTPTFTPTDTETPVTPSVGGGPGDGAQVNPSQNTPFPAYVVWTATPTAPPVALELAFTPLPTVTPGAAFEIAQFIAPSTESVILMALCFIFFGASGLGIAGLITSALYLRSRKQGDFFGE